MADVMTVRQFRAHSGYSGIGRVIRPLGNLGAIFSALKKFDAVRMAGGARGIAAVREVRRACVKAIGNAHDPYEPDMRPIWDLLASATDYVEEESYFVYGGKHDAQVLTPGDGPKRALQGAKLGGHRPHNVLDSAYADEKARGVHWGVAKDMGTATKIQKDYDEYVKRVSGSKLSIGLFAKYVLTAHLEDDPKGQCILRMLQTRSYGVRKILEGVTYCNEQERQAYRLDFRGGQIYHASGRLFDTTPLETMESGFGYGIFVIGFDGYMYSHSHVPDQFHHSSFMSGEPVICAGEIAVTGGDLRFISNKTGHYKSTERELAAAVRYLGKRFVDRSKAVVQVYPDKKMFWATEWIHNQGRAKPMDYSPVNWQKTRLEEPCATPQFPIP